ncbi:MAG: AAA family ATPase [Actinomycetota bacterium]
MNQLLVGVGHNTIKLSPVERNLVALLAAAGPDGLDTERLADGLWADRLPPSWSASLRNSISRLNAKVAAGHPESARLISERSPVRRLEINRDTVDLWRLFDWAAGAHDRDEPDLLLGAPFPGCEMPPLLRAAAERVVGARQDVVARWEADGAALPNHVLAAVRQLCADDPFNQTFILSAVRLHLAANHVEGARRIIDATQAELSASGIPLDEDLTAARHRLDARRPATPVTAPGPASPPLHSAVIDRLAERPIAGRAGLLSQIVAESLQVRSGGIALHGLPGIGKTRLAAEVALRLKDAGFHTAYVVADQDMFGSLQPFLDTFRGLRELVAPHLDQLHQPAANTKARTEIIGHLEQIYAGRPLCLVVDDAHWLDAQSRSLLLSICRASLDIDVFCIAVGRPRDGSATWSNWVQDLGRAGLPELRLRAIDREAMHELIDWRVPEVTRAQAPRLADQLLELSSGIPEVADRLLQRIDRRTLEIATEDVDGTGYAAVVSTMDAPVRSCGAVAALLGMRFTLADLCRLGELSELEAGRQVASLVDDGLLLELPMPDEFRFLHVMAAEALRQTLSTREQQELHARAFRLFTDPHRLAWHAERSVPLIPADAAARALLDAARLSYAEGDFPVTSRNIDHAERLSAETVGLDEEVLRLDALERSGVRATGERRRTTGRALAVGDDHAAVAAATSGLPDTEDLSGDPDRIDVLQLIDQERLSTADRVHLNVHLSRQLLFVGRIEEAQRVADRAYAEAESPDELARTWMAAQLPGGLGLTTTRPSQMPWFSKIESRELQAGIRQVDIINAIGAGRSRAAYPDILDQVRLTTESGLAQLAWFARVYQATALIDQGDHEQATVVAAQTYRLGERAGLRIAAGTYQTQHFVWTLLEGAHGDLYESTIQPGPDEPGDNIVFDAASAASLHAGAAASGDEVRLQTARRAVAEVGRRASSSAFDLAVIGMLADAMADGGPSELVEWAVGRLAPMHGSYLILASAVANLGPVEGVSALLTADRSEKADLFRTAMNIADRDALPLWQILGRLRLRAAIGAGDTTANHLFSEAQELAVTPWLAGMVAAANEGARIG